jgi:hypothetical protein
VVLCRIRNHLYRDEGRNFAASQALKLYASKLAIWLSASAWFELGLEVHGCGLLFGVDEGGEEWLDSSFNACLRGLGCAPDTCCCQEPELGVVSSLDVR